MTQVSRKGFRDKYGKQVVIVPKVPGATAGNLASLDEEGNLLDSGKKPADFALAGHSHSVIQDASTESSISIDEGIISIEIEREGSGGETEINADNIGNLHRALQDPVKSIDNAPTYSDSKLITAAAVKKYMDKKIDTPIIMNLSEDSGDPYFLYGDGENTNMENINSVKDFIQATQQNTIVLCNVHVTHRSGSTSVPDDEYNISGYAMWSLSGSTATVRLVVLGYAFDCQVYIDGLDDAGSYSNYWTKTSFSL